MRQFEAAMKRLATICNCVICNEPEDIENLSRYKTFCAPLLAEVLVVTLRNLAMILVDTELQPYRSGLEALYRDYETLPVEGSLRLNRVVKSLSMKAVYRTAERIYTGRSPKGVSLGTDGNTPSAFSANGMTFYLDILRQLSDSPGTAALLHAVPGNMSLASNRVYTVAKDSPPADNVEDQVINYKPLSTLPSTPIDTSEMDLHAELMITESPRDISVQFCFSRAGRLLCSMGPSTLVDRLARASFSVCCPRHQCPRLQRPLNSVFTADGEGRVDARVDVDSGRLVVVRRHQGNILARCIALQQNGKYDPPSMNLKTHYSRGNMKPEDNEELLYHENVILKSDECWSCCIRAALRTTSKNKRFLPVVYVL